MKPRVVVVWLVVCLLWSSTFAFIRLGLQDLPPFTFAWLRLAIAVAVLAPIAIAGGHWRSLSGRDVAAVCGTGVLLLGVNYGLVFWGAQFVPSGLVAILLSGTPVLALGFGWFLGSEGVNARKLVALTLGILGVVVIFGAEAGTSGQAALLGGVAVFGASVCVAFAYVWLKTHGHHLSPTAVTALQSLAGLLPLAGLGLGTRGRADICALVGDCLGGAVVSCAHRVRPRVLVELLAAPAHGRLGDADDGRGGSANRRRARCVGVRRATATERCAAGLVGVLPATARPDTRVGPACWLASLPDSGQPGGTSGRSSSAPAG